jgi:hypothetical protein
VELALSQVDRISTIIRIATAHPGFIGSTLVHLARDPQNATPRVIGDGCPHDCCRGSIVDSEDLHGLR